MNLSALIRCAAAVALAFGTNALAGVSVMSGYFSGEEDTTDPLNQPNLAGACGVESPRPPYTVVGPLTVDAVGSYRILDSGNSFGNITQDSVITLFEGMPDLEDLAANQVGSADDDGTVDLEPNVEYYAFVQPWCQLFEFNNGVWSQYFDGPGLVTGPQMIEAPDSWAGEWTSDDPIAESFRDPGCPDARYDTTGPHRFDRTGLYWMGLVSDWDDQILYISVHDGPVDPQNLAENRVGGAGFGSLYLERDTDYYFLVQPDCVELEGPWSYVLFPPTPPVLNETYAGTYTDPETNGHGVLLDLDPDQGNVAFGAWFTWESDGAAGADRTQAVGNPDQRWLTLLGIYEEGASSVDVQFYSAEGGAFDGAATNTAVPAGTGRLEMDSCEEGTLTFALDSGESGTRSMLRNLLVGNVRTCYETDSGPWVLYE